MGSDSSQSSATPPKSRTRRNSQVGQRNERKSLMSFVPVPSKSILISDNPAECYLTQPEPPCNSCSTPKSDGYGSSTSSSSGMKVSSATSGPSPSKLSTEYTSETDKSYQGKRKKHLSSSPDIITGGVFKRKRITEFTSAAIEGGAKPSHPKLKVENAASTMLRKKNGEEQTYTIAPRLSRFRRPRKEAADGLSESSSTRIQGSGKVSKMISDSEGSAKQAESGSILTSNPWPSRSILKVDHDSDVECEIISPYEDASPARRLTAKQILKKPSSSKKSEILVTTFNTETETDNYTPQSEEITITKRSSDAVVKEVGSNDPRIMTIDTPKYENQNYQCVKVLHGIAFAEHSIDHDNFIPEVQVKVGNGSENMGEEEVITIDDDDDIGCSQTDTISTRDDHDETGDAEADPVPPIAELITTLAGAQQTVMDSDSCGEVENDARSSKNNSIGIQPRDGDTSRKSDEEDDNYYETFQELPSQNQLQDIQDNHTNANASALFHGQDDGEQGKTKHILANPECEEANETKVTEEEVPQATSAGESEEFKTQKNRPASKLTRSQSRCCIV